MGNFGIVDGRTIVLYDAGQMVELSQGQLLAPAKFLAGMFLGNARMTAAALVSMSEEGNRLTRAERDALVQRIAASIAPSVTAAKHALSLDGAIAVLNRVMTEESLTPMAQYLQLLKTSTSMGGNVVTYSRGGTSLGGRQLLGVLSNLFRDFTGALSPWRYVVDQRKTAALDTSVVAPLTPITEARPSVAGAAQVPAEILVNDVTAPVSPLVAGTSVVPQATLPPLPMGELQAAWAAQPTSPRLFVAPTQGSPGLLLELPQLRIGRLR